MSDKVQIGEEELHAFIDGELDTARAQKVAAMIETDRSLAERIAGFRADKIMLKQFYGPIADQPVPEALLAFARPKRLSVSWRLVGSIAAAILIVFAGTIAYRSFWPTPATGIVEQALDARKSARKPEEVVRAAKGHIYNAVLQRAIAANVKVPDLQKLGYRLVAIHIFSRSVPSSAELVYHDRAGRVFTLYITRSDGRTRFDQFERDGLHVCVWQDEELSAVMMGNMSTAAMQRLASLAYTGLTL